MGEFEENYHMWTSDEEEEDVSDISSQAPSGDENQRVAPTRCSAQFSGTTDVDEAGVLHPPLPLAPDRRDRDWYDSEPRQHPRIPPPPPPPPRRGKKRRSTGSGARQEDFSGKRIHPDDETRTPRSFPEFVEWTNFKKKAKRAWRRSQVAEEASSVESALEEKRVHPGDKTRTPYTFAGFLDYTKGDEKKAKKMWNQSNVPEDANLAGALTASMFDEEVPTELLPSPSHIPTEVPTELPPGPSRIPPPAHLPNPPSPPSMPSPSRLPYTKLAGSKSVEPAPKMKKAPVPPKAPPPLHLLAAYKAKQNQEIECRQHADIVSEEDSQTVVWGSGSSPKSAQRESSMENRANIVTSSLFTTEGSAKNEEVEIRRARLTLPDELDSETFSQLMKTLLLSRQAKEEPSDDDGIDEPTPARVVDDSQQMKLLKEWQREAWKHDPARNTDVLHNEATRVELCDVRKLQHPSGFERGGPYKGELVDEIVQKLVEKSMQPSDLMMMVAVRCKKQLFVIFGNRQLKALHLAQEKMGYKHQQIKCIVHDLSKKVPPELIAQFILASSCDYGDVEHQSESLHEDQAQNDEVDIVSMRLPEELDLKVVLQLMSIVGAGPKIKEELSDDGNENDSMDEPSTKAAILDAEQMKRLRTLQQGASKLDPAQNQNALAEWKKQVQPCDVADLRQTHDTVAPHFLHGPHKRQSIDDLAKKLVAGMVKPSDLTMMVAVRCKDHLWVVFGNRRLKALKIAASQGAVATKIDCIVHDMLDYPPPPPELIAKFILASTTQNEGVGASVRLISETKSHSSRRSR